MKKIITIVMSLLMFMTSVNMAFALERETVSQFSDEKIKIDVPYEYPLTPEDPEWKTIQLKDEKVAKCQIPENILKRMTTLALLETVLNYPYFKDYITFDNYEIAARMMEENFNGFASLLQREDLTEVLIMRYNNVCQEMLQYTNRSNKNALECLMVQNNLEFLIVYDQLKNGIYSGKSAEAIDRLLKVKDISKKRLGYISGDTYERFAGQVVSPLDVNTTVYTPKGTPVSVIKVTEDYTMEEKAYYDSQLDSMYPNATRLRSACRKYNCHSYTWYSQASSNSYWMDDPEAYWQDGSYTQHGQIRPSAGYKITYGMKLHSGIVYQTSSDVTQILIKSKWGEGGLYLHKIGDCSYTGLSIMYYK